MWRTCFNICIQIRSQSESKKFIGISQDCDYNQSAICLKTGKFTSKRHSRMNMQGICMALLFVLGSSFLFLAKSQLLFTPKWQMIHLTKNLIEKPHICSPFDEYEFIFAVFISLTIKNTWEMCLFIQHTFH